MKYTEPHWICSEFVALCVLRRYTDTPFNVKFHRQQHQHHHHHFHLISRVCNETSCIVRIQVKPQYNMRMRILYWSAVQKWHAQMILFAINFFERIKFVAQFDKPISNYIHCSHRNRFEVWHFSFKIHVLITLSC